MEWEELVSFSKNTSLEARQILGVNPEIVEIGLFNDPKHNFKGRVSELLDGYYIELNLYFHESLEDLKVTIFHEVFHIWQMENIMKDYRYWEAKSKKHFNLETGVPDIYWFNPIEWGAYIFGNSLGKCFLRKEIMAYRPSCRYMKEFFSIMAALKASMTEEELFWFSKS